MALYQVSVTKQQLKLRAKQIVEALQIQTDQTDAAIDKMVYELYGLTEDEIEIAENS
ncbi:hypothetical protein [Winogradskyella vidalii]|uniref:hypothetical protein n=1 Tax=Winogradskyella vidalii TaxID=2615024 RepID=UPI0015C73C24|nr:hypothetical protein [Winogradskyella vidalii]